MTLIRLDPDLIQVPSSKSHDYYLPLLFKILASMMGLGLPGVSVGRESDCNAGDPGLIPGSGISLGEGNGNLL